MTAQRRSARLLAKSTSKTTVVKVDKVIKSPTKTKKPLKKKPVVDTEYPTLSNPQQMTQALEHLKRADPKLFRFISTVKEPCVLSLPRDTAHQSSYVSLCQSIIYQQLAGKAAQAILQRFVQRFGTPVDSEDEYKFPEPSVVIELNLDEMKQTGVGQRKAEYLKEVAQKFHSGQLSDKLLSNMSDTEVSEVLVSIRGIGQWTADMFLIFHLKRPDILPTLDLAIRKAMSKHFNLPFSKTTPTHQQMVEAAQVWAPYRSVATWYMWKLAGTIVQK